MTIAWRYHFFKLASRLVCLLPYRLVLALGRMLGPIYYAAAQRQRDRALAQIRDRLSVPPDQAEKLIRRLFINLAQTFFEVLYTPALNPTNITGFVTIENRQYLDEAAAEGRGVAVLAAHLGNWEWLGAALALYGYPVASIIKKQQNEQYTRLINEFRRMAGITLYAKGRESSELIGVVKALKQGCVVGFFSDQDAGKNGAFIDFLGAPASTPGGIAVFAKRLGCPVVPAFIVRRPGGGHRIIVQPPEHFISTGNDASDQLAFTVKMTRIIEDIIRLYPDEWLWFQKRWNSQPTPSPLSMDTPDGASQKRGDGV